MVFCGDFFIIYIAISLRDSAKSGLGCKAALEVLCRNMVRGQMSDDNPTYAPAEPKLVTLDKGSLDPNGGKNNKKCCK